MASINDISKSKVGESVEFQREAPNLFQMIEQGERRKQQKEQAEQKKKQAELDKFNDFVKYNSPEFWHEFDEEIKGKYNDYQDFVAKARRDGTYTNPDVLSEISKRRADIDMSAKATMQVKNDMTKAYDEGMKQDGVIPDRYQQKLIELYTTNPDGSRRSVSDLKDIDRSTLMNDESLYNYGEVMSAFVKNIADIHTENTKNIGTRYEQTKTNVKSYVQLDSSGNIVYDEHGKAKLNVTNDLVSEAMTNPAIASRVTRMVEEQKKKGVADYSERDALETLLMEHTDTKESKSYMNNTAAIDAINKKANEGNVKDAAIATISPYVALMQGQGWDKDIIVNGKAYKTASIPFGTNKISDNEFIDKLLYDEVTGVISYTTKDKDNQPVQTEPVTVPKTGALLTLIMGNIGNKFDKGVTQWINNYMNTHKNPDGTMDWSGIVSEKTEIAPVTEKTKKKLRVQKYQKNYNKFLKPSPAPNQEGVTTFDWDKFKSEVGTEEKEVASNLAKMAEKSGVKVEIKLEDTIGDDELTLVINDEEVEGYKSLDHDSESDMEKLTKYLRNLTPQAQTTEVKTGGSAPEGGKVRE